MDARFDVSLDMTLKVFSTVFDDVSDFFFLSEKLAVLNAVGDNAEAEADVNVNADAEVDADNDADVDADADAGVRVDADAESRITLLSNLTSASLLLC